MRRRACTMTLVNWIILIAGVAGLVCAGYGLMALSVNAWRRRRYVDIALALAVAAGTVLALIAFGDRVVR